MIRKTVLVTVALFALLAATASAHSMSAMASCGSVTLQWLSFNDGSNGNALNGGENTPTWTISFTPDGSSTPIVTSGQVAFGNMPTLFGEVNYSISEPIPAENGTLAVSSSWTASQTSDGYASSSTVPLTVTDCVAIATPPTPSPAPPSPAPPTPAAPPPSFTLHKLEAVSNSGQPFTPGPITVNIGQQIDYQIVVTNTGPTPLSLALVDTMCTAISAPTGNIAGGELQAGGTATYTCVHVVTAGDAPLYINVAQVTATPPGGSPLAPQRSSVIANVPRGGVSACVATSAKLTESRKRDEVTATVGDADHGRDITKVVFLLDGHPVRTLTKPNVSGGRFQLRLDTAKTRYGAHRVTASVSMVCGPAQVRTTAFQHAVPAIKVSPKLTG